MAFEELVEVDKDGHDVYVARPPGQGFLFGGLVIGVGLRAASHTVAAGMTSHSVHAYFLRSGQWGQPLRVEVERTRDGGSFATRRVTVLQDGELLATLAVSFHVGEEKEDWHTPLAPSRVGPADASAVSSLLGGLDIIEVRPVDPGYALGHLPVGSATIHPYWCRVRRPLPDDTQLHYCALAFMSDYLVIWASGMPGSPIPPERRTVTVDHSVWLHRPSRADEWHLFSAEPISIANGRSTVRGTVQTASGLLVASFVQEDSVRAARPRTA
jgi:acyl-CoA thioesterase II